MKQNIIISEEDNDILFNLFYQIEGLQQILCLIIQNHQDEKEYISSIITKYQKQLHEIQQEYSNTLNNIQKQYLPKNFTRVKNYYYNYNINTGEIIYRDKK